MSDRKLGWEIGELYQNSWKVVKKNKVLWIFGAGLSGLGGSASFNNLSLPNDFNPPNTSPGNTPSVTPEKLDQVLGIAQANPFPDLLVRLFSSVPTEIYWLLGLEFGVLVVVSCCVLIVYLAWLHGALIHGTRAAASEKKITIHNLSIQSFSSLKTLIRLILLVILISIGIYTFFGLIIGLTIVGIFVIPTILVKIILGLLILPLLILFLVCILFLGFTEIWAIRLVALEKTPAIPSLKSGLRAAKKHFFPMFGLGILNNLLCGFASFVPFVFLIIAIVLGVIVYFVNKSLLPWVIGIESILFLFFVVASQVLGGVLFSFKASVWTNAYEKIKEEFKS